MGLPWREMIACNCSINRSHHRGKDLPINTNCRCSFVPSVLGPSHAMNNTWFVVAVTMSGDCHSGAAFAMVYSSGTHCLMWHCPGLPWYWHWLSRH